MIPILSLNLSLEQIVGDQTIILFQIMSEGKGIRNQTDRNVIVEERG